MNKLTVVLAGKWLTFVYRLSDKRIRAGDLDLDDVFYRSRDASNALLDIWYPHWEKKL